MRKKKRDTNRIVIQKIISYCNDIENFISRFSGSLEVYQSENYFRYACDMCILQIGELTTRLSEEFKEQYSEISWHSIKALRNIHAHDYESINFEYMWKILTEDIPELKAQLAEILSREEKSD